MNKLVFLFMPNTQHSISIIYKKLDFSKRNAYVKRWVLSLWRRPYKTWQHRSVWLVGYCARRRSYQVAQAVQTTHPVIFFAHVSSPNHRILLGMVVFFCAFNDIQMEFIPQYYSYLKTHQNYHLHRFPLSIFLLSCLLAVI